MDKETFHHWVLNRIAQITIKVDMLTAELAKAQSQAEMDYINDEVHKAKGKSEMLQEIYNEFDLQES